MNLTLFLLMNLLSVSAFSEDGPNRALLNLKVVSVRSTRGFPGQGLIYRSKSINTQMPSGKFLEMRFDDQYFLKPEAKEALQDCFGLAQSSRPSDSFNLQGQGIETIYPDGSRYYIIQSIAECSVGRR